MPNINVKISDEINQFLEERAKRNETNISHEVRQILKKEYLTNNDNKV